MWRASDRHCSAANATAAASTTRVIAAAEDEVSAAIASLFSGHAQAFHALSAQAADFHSQFVQALNAGARAYASSEAANAGPLQTLAQDLLDPNIAVSVGGHTLQFGTATATSGPGSLAIAVGTNSSAEAGSFFVTGQPINWMAPPLGSRNLAVAVGADSNASAFVGNHNIAAALGNDLSATAVGGNATDIVTPFGTAGGAAGLLRSECGRGQSVAARSECVRLGRDRHVAPLRYREHLRLRGGLRGRGRRQ